MSSKSGLTPIESHTEYTHTRFRCPRCGTVVPEEDESALCVKCERATSA
mgnify:CR=1 FL=1